MRPGDRLCDPRQRGIRLAGVLEAILQDRDNMGPPAPFAHQARAWSQLRAGGRRQASACLQLRGEGRQLPSGRFAHPAKVQLLQAVGDAADEEIATEAWRLAPVEPPPLCTKLAGIELFQPLEPLAQPCPRGVVTLSEIGPIWTINQQAKSLKSLASTLAIVGKFRSV
jgi:hypothetical protein